MSLARPEWLWLFAGLPLLAVVAVLSRARRSHDWHALGQGERHVPDGSALWLAAVAAMIVALAQPRWGRSDVPPLPPGHDVVIAVDVSRSMAARDAVPNRLGVAVESAESLIAALGQEPGDRVAVVAFAGRGVLRCPLTRNTGAAVEALRSLRPGAVSPGGSDLGAGLDAALDAFDGHDRAGGRSVVVFSDGEDRAGHWRPAAERLRDRGVIVHTVAVGDASLGHPIPSGTGHDSEPLRDRGTVVLSRRSDEALATIARATGGAFVPLGLATTDMGRLYRSRIEPGARAVRLATLAPERGERFSVFLVAALGFVLAACWPRRSAARAMLAGALAFVLAGAAPREAVTEGRAAYDDGRYVEALKSFRIAMTLAPGDPIPAFDAAAALFQLGRFDEARALYFDARRVAGADLRTKTDFALGNTAAALGDDSAAIRHYDDCLASTAPGPDLDLIRRDAAINRRFVEERARHVPPPPGPGGDRPLSPAPPKPGNPPGSTEGPGKTPGKGASQNAPSGKRGAGGAGGGGPAQAEPGSPEDQLDRVLDNVRDARRRRIEETSAVGAEEDRNDW